MYHVIRLIGEERMSQRSREYFPGLCCQTMQARAYKRFDVFSKSVPPEVCAYRSLSGSISPVSPYPTMGGDHDSKLEQVVITWNSDDFLF